MATKPNTYQCTECGWTSVRWVGRCGECQAWGTVVERNAPRLTKLAPVVPVSKARSIADVSSETARRASSGIPELDRVLGGGLVPGGVILLAGEPGVGKSTLLLEVAARWAGQDRRALYVSGEESASQVRLRADRTGALAAELYVASETDLGVVLGQIEEVKPSLVVVDSVQTINSPAAEGVPGGVNQVREVTAELVHVAKQQGICVVLVGHVTKDGSIAGPRTMEHLVDVVLSFEGDRHTELRLVRATKNRFGPADEVGCFRMTEQGIAAVADPSGLFLSTAVEPVVGTCATVTMAGRRPLLAEVQALVAPAVGDSQVRRVTSGIDFGRAAMILAVLERKAKLRLHRQDVYLSSVGGARISDPSSDLAAAIAVASSAVDRNYPKRVLALGEVGLAGELRPVPGLEKRLNEAARVGFEIAVVPEHSREHSAAVQVASSLQVVEARSVVEVLSFLDLRRARGGE